jgi:probable rRNA maturation factor
MWKQLSPTWKREISFALERATAYLKRDFSKKEVSVVFAGDQEIQNLNKTFRHKDKPTNVLSFPSDEKNELGDIILAYETIVREAQESHTSAYNHTLHLIIHGFLHLLGYDHEEKKEAEVMMNMEIQILKDLNINNPYEDK